MLKSVMHQILITCLLRKYISINIEFNFIRGVTISKVKHKRPVILRPIFKTFLLFHSGINQILRKLGNLIFCYRK